MKFKLIFLPLIILSVQAYSQSKNNISLLYGASATTVDIHGAIGDYGYNSKTGMLYGLTYSRALTGRFSIVTGLLFTDDHIEISSLLPGVGNRLTDGDVKMISVPIYGKFSFLKYFYADAGFSFDKQTNYSDNSVGNDQSGVGFELGIGGKCTIGRASIFVNPYLKEFSIVSFAGSNNNLLEAGVKFGVGYNF